MLDPLEFGSIQESEAALDSVVITHTDGGPQADDAVRGTSLQGAGHVVACLEHARSGHQAAPAHPLLRGGPTGRRSPARPLGPCSAQSVARAARHTRRADPPGAAGPLP